MVFIMILLKLKTSMEVTTDGMLKKELKDLIKSGLILFKGQVMTDLWQSKMLGRIKEDILV